MEDTRDGGSVTGSRSAWAHQVNDALAALDATQQLAIKLVYVHGLSQAEAAQWLSLRTSVLARAMAEGMQRLGDRLTSTRTGCREVSSSAPGGQRQRA